ncbi:MAG: glycine cleavage system protein GcvH [Rhizobiaceae bacterium]|nr:glycine cleavage system protein GcvH [Rhizobiaceae bacterium]MDF2374113.1 glycine cleavage system protein GcvH [Rhizobiaceae bacterium]|tara:strand:+ start:24236 stop:24604 length:369 start_codon:yes stop_codon:yes gene_type:complete
MASTFYTEDHEWVRVDGNEAVVGITNHAQEQLGDLVFVELPEAGRKVARGEAMIVVESVKAASDVYAPVDGEILAVNDALEGSPGLVNEAAEGDGWLVRMKLDDATQLETLLDEAAYAALVG